MSTKNSKKKIITLILALIIIALILILLISNFDSIKRRFSYRAIGIDNEGNLDRISFLDQQDNAFADYLGGIAIASVGGCEVYDIKGQRILSESFSMTNPAVISAQNRVVFYDIGGYDMFVYDDADEKLAITFDSRIISVHINRNGFISVVTGESGYKTSVTVYDDKCQQVYKVYISSCYVSCAAVANDNKYLIVGGVTYDDNGFFSKVIRYNLDKSEEIFSVCLDDSAVISISFISDNCICVLTERGIFTLDESLNIKGSYLSDGEYVVDAGFSSEGYVSLLLKQQKSGNRATILTLDDKCKVLGAIDTVTEVLDISACGKYVAILYPGVAEIFTSEMDLYDTTESTHSARSLIMREDGTLLLIAASSSVLYIP